MFRITKGNGPSKPETSIGFLFFTKFIDLNHRDSNYQKHLLPQNYLSYSSGVCYIL